MDHPNVTDHYTLQCVPEEVTAEIVSLKNLVAEKTADIETHSKKIVLLEEQLQVFYEHEFRFY